MQYPLDNVLQARARLGEGPVWDATQQVLYWVDIYNHRVHQFNPSAGSNPCGIGKAARFFDVGDVVGAVAPAGPNRLILAQRHHLAILDTETGTTQPIALVEVDLPENRFNDGKCDCQGRFWFGSMCPDKAQGSLYRYDPDGALHTMETGLTISNGLGWSPDETTFYLTDSVHQKIYAYDFEPTIGSIYNRRIFVDLTGAAFYPDGLTIDQEGHVWSAMWDGWCIVRFDPQGKEVLRIPLPVQRPTSCTFGGTDLRSLYITTASVGLSEQEIERSFYAGDLFCLKTDITGLPASSFGG